MSFTLTRGTSPVILCFPHVGTAIPDDVAGRLNAAGAAIRDTDWHVDRLYRDLLPEATTLVAHEHRYVVDLNRDPSGASLYPGQNTTGVVPVTDFDGAPIWREGMEPDAAEIARRIEACHRPYHDALRGEIERIRGLHGVAVVYDCHSIRSRIPYLFEGVLPDLNIGTNGGTSCAPAIEAAAIEAARAAATCSSVLNGRFKGGWTTRHYGRPDIGVHAIQMELAQSTHLASEAPPFAYHEEKAERIRVHLHDILTRIAALAPTLTR